MPVIGPISGNSDFVTAQVGGNLPLRLFGSMVGATRPKLLVVEAETGSHLARTFLTDIVVCAINYAGL